MAQNITTLHPPLPVPDPVSAPFWEGVGRGVLLVQRCGNCGRLQFPFDLRCKSCDSTEVAPYEVSGRGAVFSYTETVSGARHPYFEGISPYLVGQVQLAEQDDLILMSNFPGSTYNELWVGAPVRVEFHELARGVFIPQFRATESIETGQ
ncbi:MAG TPA: OB-fold domain-containing protein [Solirubrobacteraceae bacterium]|nr:OB-fold domain-containing protein [Solirubrobacteraceae bacterium]